MPTSSRTSSGNNRNRPPGETSEARIAKALAHPLRARILQRLGERVASPGDLAVELGAPLGVLSYHVRMLRDYDCVELVRTEPRRGALQHFYRATQRLYFDESLKIIGRKPWLEDNGAAVGCLSEKRALRAF